MIGTPRWQNAINDPRIRYKHAPEAMTIGAKRNDLCAAANGEIIAHFDDDDLYGPHYIKQMFPLWTTENSISPSFSAFSFITARTRFFSYWDLETDFPVLLSRAG